MALRDKLKREKLFDQCKKNKKKQQQQRDEVSSLVRTAKHSKTKFIEKFFFDKLVTDSRNTATINMASCSRNNPKISSTI